MKSVSIDSLIINSAVANFLHSYSVAIELFKKVVKKACHCNKIFLRKTRLILMLNHFIPRCPYYCTYFAFRRSGIHPPKFS